MLTQPVSMPNGHADCATDVPSPVHQRQELADIFDELELLTQLLDPTTEFQAHHRARLSLHLLRLLDRLKTHLALLTAATGGGALLWGG